MPAKRAKQPQGDSTPALRREMRARGEATRPQLARACGLSLVTVNRLMQKLCVAGEMEAVGDVSSGGGRPVQLYRLRRAASWVALLHLRAEGGVLLAELELLDPLGARLRQAGARFAHIEEGTLGSWLEGVLHQVRTRRRLLGITIEAGNTPPLPPTLYGHLAARFACPCRRVSVADALAERREDTLTLCFAEQAAPLATLYRHGVLQACGELAHLPLPADWAALDYEDHTLVEEMVARLLQILCCTLAPTRVVLYGTFWSERLLRRIRYNLSTKLRNTPLPPLSFRRHAPDAAEAALKRLALEVEG